MTLIETLKSLSWINIAELERVCNIPRTTIRLDGSRPIPEKYIEVIHHELQKASVMTSCFEDKISKDCNFTKPVVQNNDIVIAHIFAGNTDIDLDYDPDELVDIVLKKGLNFATVVGPEVDCYATIYLNGIEYTLNGIFLVDENGQSLIYNNSYKAKTKRKYIKTVE